MKYDTASNEGRASLNTLVLLRQLLLRLMMINNNNDNNGTDEVVKQASGCRKISDL